MAMCIFCYTQVTFVSGGITVMDFGLMRLSLCGHKRKPPHTKKKIMMAYEEENNGVCCQLCVHHLGDISECGTCQYDMLISRMPLHGWVFGA